MDEIKDFDSLKAVADDIHARAGEMGFDVFSMIVRGDGNLLFAEIIEG